MLMPRKVKYKRKFKGRSKGVSSRATTLAFGSYGLKSLEARWITARQIEAARRAVIRHLKKGGKLWIRIFPDKPITSKGVEFSMGGGKGSVSHYVYPIKPGRIIFELEGIGEDIAKKALRTASDKLSVKTKFIKK
ncbi:MAG: 50S ribosomal protein L16 [Patescibacteria group bacterium]|nr:50S ribosomal protein L16 [Patescibacteria group bacterium]